MKPLRVLSLFDGISCGQVALERAGIPVEVYYASEIDKYAIQITQKNYPNTIQLGDVTKIDFAQFIGKVDLIIGGSPCSWWSNARSSRGGGSREKSAEGNGYDLFMKYVEALKIIKPKYFLYENNHSISKDIKEAITKELGVNFILINSSLVSAQNRKRCYWTNIPTREPKDKNILIGDVIPNAINGAAYRHQIVKGKLTPQLNIRKDGKSNCLLAYMANKNCCVQLSNGEVRPLTAEEFELLQTLPLTYTEGINNSKRKSVISLGWTIDVIAHIFSFGEIKNETI